MKTEWGKKVCCSACSNIFYDMRKSEVICPKCDTKFKVAAQKKTGKTEKKHKKFAILDDDEFGLSDDYRTIEDANNIENGSLVMEND